MAYSIDSSRVKLGLNGYNNGIIILYIDMKSPNGVYSQDGGGG